jgi:hypothetical protein
MKSVAIVRHPAAPVSHQPPHRARQNTLGKSGAFSDQDRARAPGSAKRVRSRRIFRRMTRAAPTKYGSSGLDEVRQIQRNSWAGFDPVDGETGVPVTTRFAK